MCLFLAAAPAAKTTVFADNIKTQDAISDMVEEHIDKAHVPTVSVGFVQNGNAEFLSYGNPVTDRNSLYQIGSTSKAFTALGILWLEDEGLLSLNDPVSDYLPWFSVNYKGQEVPGSEITVANLIYQTSGFTNNETKYPKPEPDVTLESYIRSFCGEELQYYPSSQYSYANINYSVLGLIIEAVSGQSYSEFMKTAILEPMGLFNTYTDPAAAQQTGLVAEGRRLMFFKTFRYDVPVSIASVPAGYIYSNTSDIGRWLQIQIGAIEISPRITRIIEKSHIPDKEHSVDENTRYAAGWFVTNDGIIYHTGGTPNYSAKFILDRSSNSTVCVLVNCNSTVNTNMIADNILNILNGNPLLPYQSDIWVIFDKVFTLMTYICIPLIFMTAALIFKKKSRIKNRLPIKHSKRRRKVCFLLVPVIFILLSVIMMVIFPIIFQISWIKLSIWGPYSMFTGIISFTILSVLLLISANLYIKYPKQDL